MTEISLRIVWINWFGCILLPSYWLWSIYAKNALFWWFLGPINMLHTFKQSNIWLNSHIHLYLCPVNCLRRCDFFNNFFDVFLSLFIFFIPATHTAKFNPLAKSCIYVLFRVLVILINFKKCLWPWSWCFCSKDGYFCCFFGLFYFFKEC